MADDNRYASTQPKTAAARCSKPAMASGKC